MEISVLNICQALRSYFPSLIYFYLVFFLEFLSSLLAKCCLSLNALWQCNAFALQAYWSVYSVFGFQHWNDKSIVSFQTKWHRMHVPKGEKQRMLEKQTRIEWKMMTMTNDNNNNKLKALHGHPSSSLHFYCLFVSTYEWECVDD